MEVRPLLHLEFTHEKLEQEVRALCAKALRKGWISPKQKWLGTYYARELSSGYTEDLDIIWISEEMGYGVFAKKDLKPYTYIGEYTGIVYKRRFRRAQNSYYCFDYAFQEEKRSPYSIDAYRAGNITRYINHSDTPNVESVSVFHEGLLHIILRTIHPVAQGAQLVYDYGEEYWKKRKDTKL